jgi:hypothetical protein
MDSNQVHIGYVVRFFKERDYGFIEDENGASYFFFRNNDELKKKKKAGLIPFIHCFSVGDRVSYKLRVSQRKEDEIEACEVEFITNENKELLVSEFLNNSILEGYIKIMAGGKFFVRHKTTQLDIPISISVWEENIDEVYRDRENQLVSFKLTQVGRFDKLTALLIDAQLMPEYYELMSHFSNQTTLPALITKKNKFGFHASLCTGKISGFINISPKFTSVNIEKINQIQVGNIVDVGIRYPLREQNLKVSLAFV